MAEHIHIATRGVNKMCISAKPHGELLNCPVFPKHHIKTKRPGNIHIAARYIHGRSVPNLLSVTKFLRDPIFPKYGVSIASGNIYIVTRYMHEKRNRHSLQIKFLFHSVFPKRGSIIIVAHDIHIRLSIRRAALRKWHHRKKQRDSTND